MPKLALALLTIVSLAPGCASTAGMHAPAAGEPMRVTLFMYGQGGRFELANAAHTDPVELYSRSRNSASMKITTDDVMLEIIDFLGGQGFDELERPGKAPGGGIYSLAFEVETSSGTSHWGTNTKTSSADELNAMNDCVRFYLNEKYNNVQAYQTMDNTQGGQYFQDGGR